MRLKLLYTAFFIGSALTILSSCGSGGDNPGYEYAPNMYVSFAYEPMTQESDKPNTINPNGMNMRLPVKNTVARGQMDFAKYDFKVSNEGYEASASLKNPVAASPAVPCPSLPFSRPSAL